MTNSKKSLFARNWKKALNTLSKLSIGQKVAFGFLFFVMFMLTCGGSGAVSMAVLMLLPDGMKLSGRSQGTVFTVNNIRRNFAMPRNPQSSSQVNIRNFFGSFSSLWRSLTLIQQAAWRNISFTVTNRVGQSIKYAGKEAYVRLNIFLALIGVAAIDDAPVLEGCIAPEQSATSVIDVSDAKIDLNLSNDDTTLGIVIFASLPLLAGRTKSRTAMVYTNSNSSLGALAANTWTGYLAQWGYTPIAGDRIIVSAHYVNNVTGEPSPMGVKGTITVQA